MQLESQGFSHLKCNFLEVENIGHSLAFQFDPQGCHDVSTCLLSSYEQEHINKDVRYQLVYNFQKSYTQHCGFEITSHRTVSFSALIQPDQALVYLENE